ncbi:hypothetical protein F5Y10DRAFT_84773 [Nemania abortiva]|nr:hypothetical protein F5Y10DRAFT_84773 [Nemania abortiva]
MDPLTVIGAVASVAQLLDVADRATTSARSLTHSIVNAPLEVQKLSNKLERFKLLIEHVEKYEKINRTASIDKIFSSQYRNILYELLEVNVNALQSLKSLCSPPTASPMSTRGRLRWAAIDKKKARSILEDMRDAESSLDTALSMVTMHIVSLNQTSLAALQTGQDMVLPYLKRGLDDAKEHVNTQLLQISEQIDVQTKQILQELRDNSGAEKLESSREFRPKSSNCPKQALVRTEELHQFESGALVSTQILNWHMKRIREQHSWALGSLSKFFERDAYWPQLDVAISSSSNQARRKMRFVLRMGFRLIQQHILHFEVTLRQNARQWMSIPWLGCSLTTINVRPIESPIFRACFDWDFESVRFLIETSQASIYDVDNETRRGLLEHVFRTTEKNNMNSLHYRPHCFNGQLLVEYLLDIGYNPNVFNGSEPMPATLHAFLVGCLDSVSHLLHRGADIDSFEVNPSSLLGWREGEMFQRKIRLLHSVGFSDWKVETGYSLLQSAGTSGDWDGFLFALEVVRIDPNISNFIGSPLSQIACYGDVPMMAVLIECGADINGGDKSWGGPGLNCGIGTGALHYLLFLGADINCTDAHLQNPWYHAWEAILSQQRLDYDRDELPLTHLLLHGADPFQAAHHAHISSVCKHWGCNGDHPWFHFLGYIKAPEFARAFSYPIEIMQFWDRQLPQQAIDYYEDFETRRKPQLNPFLAYDDWMTRQISHSKFHAEEFPAVRLLCNALQRAGYRAEMDCEGDIWYDDDDGDMYYDAREYQPGQGCDRPATDCFICQDFEKYGLGHIIDEIEEGKQRLYRYREEVKAGKKKWSIYD